MKIFNIFKPCRFITDTAKDGSKNARKAIIARERRISDYITLHKNIYPHDTYNKLYETRETLANYAKANNVKVRFKALPTTENSKPIDKNLIAVMVTGHKKFEIKFINSDINRSYPLEKDTIKLLTNKDGLDYIARGKHKTEDNFIRYVYRTVEELTNKVRNTNNK